MHNLYAPPLIFSDTSPFKNMGVHLGVCGSIAAFRAPDLVRWWHKNTMHVAVTLTDAAQRFITPLTFEALGAAPVYTQMFAAEHMFGHLEPGQNASVMVIAPATAATLAHICHGCADSMLACQALAFDGPMVVAPAMNPRMWQHAATQENIDILRRRGVQLVLPECGGTACGDTGQGRLADLRHIWLASLKALSVQDMQGLKVMLTLGPTREQWDAVRFWSNPSTGRMGMALAMAAWLRGAEVHALCGPLSEEYFLPPEILCYTTPSAKDMYTAAADLWPRMDVGIFTAAVADFSPVSYGAEKFKKNTAHEGLRIDFTPNTDILRTLAAQKKEGQKILGFAAETCADLLAAVRHKLAHKGAHILAGNTIGKAHSGFASSTNTMVVADCYGREEHWPTMPKTDVAWRLCSWLLEI